MIDRPIRLEICHLDYSIHSRWKVKWTFLLVHQFDGTSFGHNIYILSIIFSYFRTEVITLAVCEGWKRTKWWIWLMIVWMCAAGYHMIFYPHNNINWTEHVVNCTYRRLGRWIMVSTKYLFVWSITVYMLLLLFTSIQGTTRPVAPLRWHMMHVHFSLINTP